MKFPIGRSSKGTTKSTDLRQLHHNSVPQKSLIAIQPPKKVIKALYDYQPQDSVSNPGFLSFSKGDFLHVVGREDDPDWYEACNPIHNTRGLVPVNFFEEIGKQMRNKNSTLDQPGSRSSAGQHDSGYAEKDSQRGSVNGQGPDGDVRASTKSVARNNVAMIYGMVLFDFKAERPDELEARAGENIVVIAQSTPEWFVAKPITRLGGPGLIPVGFVEIRDTATGLAVKNTQEAIARAGIPKVEEWKKMAADYKASSIPLGRLDMQNQSLNQSMERLSVNSKTRGGLDFDHAGQEVRHSGYGSSSSDVVQQQHPELRFSQMTSPVRARVSGYVTRNGDFSFTVEAVMEDGRSWNLERTYKDFYALQLSLIEHFPEAAGKVKPYPRTLPYIPGPLPWVTEKLTQDRRELLDNYIRQLLRIDANITNCQAVRKFFFPRDLDAEFHPQQQQRDEDGASFRLSGASQASSTAPTTIPKSTHSSTGNLSIGGGSSAMASYASAQRQQHAGSPFGTKPPPNAATAHHRTASDLRSQNSSASLLDGHAPTLPRNNSSLTMESVSEDLPRTNGVAAGNQALLPVNSAAASSPWKIKVWFGESNCIVIRLPPYFTHADLVSKLRDRWSLDPQHALGGDAADARNVNFDIEYRDEQTAGFYRIEGDEDLEVAKERNEKLTLRVVGVHAGDGNNE